MGDGAVSGSFSGAANRGAADAAQSGVWATCRDSVSDLFTGAVKGSYSKAQNGAVLTGQIAAGMIPIVGQAADARDTIAALQKVERGVDGGKLELGLAILGWVPLVGDWIKGAGKGVGKKAISAIENSGEWLKQTAEPAFNSIGESLSKIKDRWFYKPQIEATPHLPAGAGQTDSYGNVMYSSLGSPAEQELVRQHELVHSFMSPKFLPLRDFRATAGMSAYQNSSLCRYVEEALAESYAQLRVNGLIGLPEGLKFPIANGYVELKDVATELAIGTVSVGGIGYGVYLTINDN